MRLLSGGCPQGDFLPCHSHGPCYWRPSRLQWTLHFLICVQAQHCPFPHHVTLGKLLKLCACFSYLWNGNTGSTHLIRLWWRLNDKMQIKVLRTLHATKLNKTLTVTIRIIITMPSLKKKIFFFSASSWALSETVHLIICTNSFLLTCTNSPGLCQKFNKPIKVNIEKETVLLKKLHKYDVNVYITVFKYLNIYRNSENSESPLVTLPLIPQTHPTPRKWLLLTPVGRSSHP